MNKNFACKLILELKINLIFLYKQYNILKFNNQNQKYFYKIKKGISKPKIHEMITH